MTYDIEADWSINLLCNYVCAYCDARASKEHRLVGRISPDQYLDFFNSTGKTWMLHITGGEPFFYPGFVGLCRTLTSRHYISLNSNLSSNRVRDFAASIDVSRVQSVHCGVHVAERDRLKGWRNLQANLSSLLERGFPLFASLVMTPSAFSEYPRVAQPFTALGVPLIPKALKGRYQGRWYPQSYTPAERAQFRDFSQQAEQIALTCPGQPFRHHPTINPLLDRNFLDGFPDFTGISCSAGRLLVSIGYDGNIFRCGGKTLLGNIFERRLDLLAADRPCDDSFCLYHCLRYSRFERDAPPDYPRSTAPGVFQQALINIGGLRRRIEDRIAEIADPPHS